MIFALIGLGLIIPIGNFYHRYGQEYAVSSSFESTPQQQQSAAGAPGTASNDGVNVQGSTDGGILGPSLDEYDELDKDAALKAADVAKTPAGAVAAQTKTTTASTPSTMPAPKAPQPAFSFAQSPMMTVEVVQKLPCAGLAAFLGGFLFLVSIFEIVVFALMTALIFCFYGVRDLARKHHKVITVAGTTYFVCLWLWNLLGTALLVKYSSCPQNPLSHQLYDLSEAVVIIIHILLDCPLFLMAIEWVRFWDDRDKDIGEAQRL